MRTHAVTRPQWKSYLERVSEQLQPRMVEIEVDSLDLGAQIEAKWAGLVALSYDPDEDVIAIRTEPLGHAISHPKSLQVLVGDDGSVAAIEIEDRAGRHQILRFKAPLMLTGA